MNNKIITRKSNEKPVFIDLHDGETVMEESCFKEVARFRLSPKEQKYGIQIPPMVWHSIEVHEPSTILEAKDGKYGLTDLTDLTDRS